MEYINYEKGKLFYMKEHITYIIEKSLKTTVVLHDGTVGMTILYGEDEFVREVGIYVAYLKAKVAQYENAKRVEKEYNSCKKYLENPDMIDKYIKELHKI